MKDLANKCTLHLCHQAPLDHFENVDLHRKGDKNAGKLCKPCPNTEEQSVTVNLTEGKWS